MSAKGSRSIQVAIKVRPCEAGLSRLWQVKEGRTIQLADSHAEPCVFDYVFDEGASNQEVFDRMAKHIVHACMQGFNGTIFAYGQTSSGKTYTMMGDNKNPGVMVLAAKEIFRQISEEKDRDFLLRVGYIEIYNEKIYDLLDKKNQDLKIHEVGNGMVNVNCEESIITCEDDLLRLLSMGNKERTVGETNMNERSSRSHAIFRIIIESRKSDRAEDDAVNQSVLNLVDLAGSERADQTGATGARLKEGGHINKSLLFLSNVIKNLAERESENGAEQSSNKFISFRDSKLTRILQASLGGNAFTSIICTIKPSILEESQSTLSFAMRAKKIKTKPQLNEMVSDATMMKRLEREIKELKDRLAEEERKNESQLKVQELERCIKRDMLKIISSTSLSDKRLQKRRRTWCPGPEKSAETQQEPSAGLAESSHLPPLSKLSHLPKPTFFPNSHITGRLDKAPKTINILQSLTLCSNDSRIDEEFLPAECIDFDAVPPAVQKTKLHSMLLPLTPVASEMKGATMERIKEIQELQTFTNLEKHFDVEWEKSQVLQEKLDQVRAEKDQLEQDCLTKEQRCEALQTEVSALKTDNLEASDKIKGYEEQLKALKDTMARLEVENRDAVTLEFQFKSQKERSAQREKDLLSALSEKDAAIEDLKKSLDEMTRDLRNSKEDLMRSMCQPAESQVCHKCDELEEVELRSNNFEKQCQQLEADNQRLQVEMDTLKETFKLEQRKLAESSKAENEALQKQITDLKSSLEEVEFRSNNFEKQCQQLEADNQRFQVEMDTLKETFELDQRKLSESSKAENEALKKQITDLQASFDEIQRENDCLSNQLMESVQENDALREELKLRPLSGLESMKSSGVGMESSVYEPDLSGEFARISESIHQIEVQLNSGCSRIFRAMKLENSQDQGMHLLKLCLESAKYVEDDSSPSDSGDSTVLKGLIKQHRFQIIRSSEGLVEERSAEEERLLAIISQLQYEIKEKNDLLNDELTNIKEMREQIITLESALLEKSVIVNKVEDYQRQIECLEKQNAEISMVCEELQEKALRDSTLCESILRVDETLPSPMPAQLDSEEMTILKISIEELNDKVIQFQGELDKQVKELQLKNENIDRLQAEIQELNERCLSMDVRQMELELESKEKQQQLDRQAQRLSDDGTLIDKLQESNANLLDRSIKAEKSLAELQERLNAMATMQDQGKVSPEQDKQLEELQEQLQNAKEDLKSKTEEINDLKLDYLQKLETCESENRANFRKYNQEWEESRDKYESHVATLKEQLLQAEREFAEMTASYQSELKDIKASLEMKLNEAEEQRNKTADMHQTELEGIREILKQKLEEQAEVDVLHSMELENVQTTLKEQCTKAEEEREKVLAKLEEMRCTLAEAVNQRNSDNEKVLELEKLKAEQDLALDVLKQEMREMESLYEKSQKLVEQLQMQIKARDEDNSDQVIVELQDKYHNQSIELESLMKEKEILSSKLEDAIAQQAESSQHLQEVKLEVESLNKEKDAQKSDMEEKIETLKAKICDFEESLQQAQQKAIEYEELLSHYEELQVSLAAARQSTAAMEEKVVDLSSQLKEAQDEVTRTDLDVLSLRQELQLAVKARESTSSEKESLLKQLEESESEIINQANKFQKQVADLQASVDELNLKTQSLQEQKSELEAGNEEMKVKLKNFQNLQIQLEEEKKTIVQLQESRLELERQLQAKDAEFSLKSEEFFREIEARQQTLNALGQQCEKLRAVSETNTILETQLKEERQLVSQLKESHMHLEDKLRVKEAEINHRSQEIHQEVEQGRRSLGELTQEYQKLRVELESKTSTFEKEKEQMGLILTKLSNENNDMLGKLRSLEEKNNKNIKLVNELKAQNADIESMREASVRELEVTKKKLLEMNQSVEVLTTETGKLRSSLKTKESGFRSEKERMDGTISSLLEDKRNLEEKVCTLNEILKKLESELASVQACGLKANGSNLSFDSNASTGSVASTAPRKSLDRNTALPAPRKSLSSELEVRRNRRISVHDENRRYSYWNDVRESSTMTDPVDSNCSCAELNSKLETCQRELFIRESQVTALNLELKHHPLKEENAQLKKRITVEQEKARSEQRRLKQKIHDLTIKINDLSEKCGASSTGEANSGNPSLVTTQTQTESELEKVMEETTKKYHETVRLCRFRAGLIKELEEKLKQNENIDTSNICSLTNGQISSLKAQCESLKKEMLTLREKYEAAKKVLLLRKDEILELREKVSSQPAK